MPDYRQLALDAARGPQNPPELGDSLAEDFSDSGNANRMIREFGTQFRYVIEWKSWVIWDGYRWEVDLGALKMNEYAKQVANSIYVQSGIVGAEGDEEAAAVLTKWARMSRNATRLDGMVKEARSVPGIPVSATELDKKPWLLVFTNGVADLRTGEFNTRPSRDDLLTKSTGHAYDPDATCPQIDDYMKWVTCDRPELEAELWRLLGYTLTGYTKERVMLVLHGGGNNGKSTLLKLVRASMGDYASSLPVATLEKQKFSRGGSAASPEIVRLKGARFVSSMESEEGMPLSAAKVKELCSNEDIIARQLYQNVVEFTPQHTLWLATNHKPNVPAEDQAVWNRLRLIPFDAYIEPENVDETLDDKLAAEIPGLLARAVREAAAWYSDGLLKSVYTEQATQEWREENDVLRDFIAWLAERADDPDPDFPRPDMGREALYQTYRAQTQLNSWAAQPISAADFKKHMLARKFTVTNRHPRVWQWPVVRNQPIDYAVLSAEYIQNTVTRTNAESVLA